MNKNDSQYSEMEEFMISIFKDLKIIKKDGHTYYIKNNLIYFKIDKNYLDCNYWNVWVAFKFNTIIHINYLLNLNKFDNNNVQFFNSQFNLSYVDVCDFIGSMAEKHLYLVGITAVPCAKFDELQFLTMMST